MMHVTIDPAAMAADVSGTNPATGTARYYTHDNLGSTRALWASDKSSLGSYEYTPYGSVYAAAGASLATLGGAFTGKPWDPTAQLYYFPCRYYSPDLARWMTRDPLGMEDGPNVYAYVRGNPVLFVDLEGASFLATVWLIIKIARLVLGVYIGFECARCVARAVETNRMAYKGLGERYWEWFCTAWPGAECIGLCVSGTGLLVPEILGFIRKVLFTEL